VEWLKVYSLSSNSSITTTKTRKPAYNNLQKSIMYDIFDIAIKKKILL
jgi:hypothetical protein